VERPRKLAVKDPEAFVAYYANDVIALRRRLLGPAYQVTSQVNVVRPRKAQEPHRDYHSASSPTRCRSLPTTCTRCRRS